MSAPTPVPLDQIQWSTPPLVAPVKNPELDHEVKKALGTIPVMMPYMYAHPTFVRVGIAAQQYASSHLPGDLSAMIGLVVSQDNSCRYCYGATRSLLKLLGYKEAYIRQLEQDLYRVELEPAQKRALEFARKLSRSTPRPDQSDFQELRAAGFSPAALEEIVFEVSMSCFSNRLATCLAIPPDPVEQMERNPFVRLFRPLIEKKLRAPKKPAPSGDGSSDPYLGPCAGLLGLLKETPAAASLLRKEFEACWTSQAVPRRTKAMMAAVVSRSVGCAASEAEAVQVLDAEGFSSSETQQIITQLASDRLTPLERKLVPFARETVRYRPQELQQKLREAVAGEPAAVVIEVIGIAALANAISRLTVLRSLN